MPKASLNRPDISNSTPSPVASPALTRVEKAIAAAELFAKHFGAERVLVVCPVSLKHQ